jgi:transcriptional regulator with XRE-family HTH domain
MSPSPEVRVGERLRFYRQAKGKTQVVVAGLAGVTEDYLSQIERGLKTPTIALLHRFSKILGVRLSEAFPPDQLDLALAMFLLKILSTCGSSCVTAPAGPAPARRRRPATSPGAGTTSQA